MASDLGAGSHRHRPGLIRRLMVGVLLPVAAIGYAGAAVYRTGGIAAQFLADDDPANRLHRVLSFRNTPDGPVRDGLGLTFDGWAGLAWATVLTLLVAAAATGAFSRATHIRRASLVVLVGSATLWTANAGYMTVIADPMWFGRFAGLHAIGLIVTLAYCWSRWRRNGGDAMPEARLSRRQGP